MSLHGRYAGPSKLNLIGQNIGDIFDPLMEVALTFPHELADR